MDRNRIPAAFVLSFLALGLLVPGAMAATFAEGESYVLAAGEVVQDDLYVFAGTVRIEGTVDGDVVAGGGTVTIAPTGVVRGDLLAAGQGVIVEGAVEDDIRAAGFTVEVRSGARVGGDFVGAGWSVSIADGATVEGDFIGAGYQGLVDGGVGGNATFAGSAMEITGAIGGDVEAIVDAGGEAAPPVAAFSFMQAQPPRTIGSGLTIADDASIGGDLTYRSPSRVAIPETAVAGTTSFREAPTDAAQEIEQEAPPPTTTDRFLGWLGRYVQEYVALFLFGLVLVLVASRATGSVSAFLADRPLPSFGWGCLSVVVAFILAMAIPVVALLVSLFFGAIRLGPLVKPVLALGLLGGVGTTAGLYLLAWVGAVVVAVWVGRRLLERLSPNLAGSRWAPLAVGLLLLVLLFSLPYLGFVMKVLVATLGIGAVVLWLWRATSAGGMTSPEMGEPIPA